MLLEAKAVAELLNMQAMQPYETPWLEGAWMLQTERQDKAEAHGCSLLAGRASTPCTRALANWIMRFPLLWYVFNWSGAHDSKELTKFVASLVNFFFLRLPFSTFICRLTPVLLPKLPSSFAVIGKCHRGIWKYVESASSSYIYRVFLLLMEKLVTWQIPSVV